jgi:Na+(H+)/acetate symporter ActP
MLALALPFIWVGVVLTLRRLRAVRLPLWLIAVFFLPVINLAFFAVLSVLPSREKEPSASRSQIRGRDTLLAKVIPDHGLGSAAMAILLTLPVGAAATGLAAADANGARASDAITATAIATAVSTVPLPLTGWVA